MFRSPSLPHSSNKGFSLIEVLVSLSIFTIVVTISVSTLYTLIEANARTRNAQSLATNLSFTLDSLTREIRTGQDYFCSDQLNELPVGASDDSTRNCAGDPYLSFNEGGQSLTGDATPAGSRRIAYRLFDGTLQRRLGNGNNVGDTDDPADWLDLTSDDIVIDELEFYVTGTTRGDEEAPSVTIFLRGTVGDETANTSDFNIQTTIAQRLLDI